MINTTWNSDISKEDPRPTGTYCSSALEARRSIAQLLVAHFIQFSDAKTQPMTAPVDRDNVRRTARNYD
jgi:hypothetical protein